MNKNQAFYLALKTFFTKRIKLCKRKEPLAVQFPRRTTGVIVFSSIFLFLIVEGMDPPPLKRLKPSFTSLDVSSTHPVNPTFSGTSGPKENRLEKSLQDLLQLYYGTTEFKCKVCGHKAATRVRNSGIVSVRVYEGLLHLLFAHADHIMLQEEVFLLPARLSKELQKVLDKNQGAGWVISTGHTTYTFATPEQIQQLKGALSIFHMAQLPNVYQASSRGGQ